MSESQPAGPPMPSSGDHVPSSTGPSPRWRIVGVVATAVIVVSVPLHLLVRTIRGADAPPPTDPLYVGSERCAACHKAVYDKWKPSNHGRAMQAARDDTVLGDFNDATFEHRGKTWRFYRRDGKFLVEAEGPDAQLHEYEVTYTFGVRPLQQYLVPFPGGRLQALSAAWDTEKTRWFFVYPGRDDIPPDDWLHWTRPGQNWNTMCADCHSTAVRKRYDVETDTFQTTWSEIMVGCEACHGPASLHVAWADQPAMARPQVEQYALTTSTSGLSSQESVNRCMPCHSRRAQFADQGRPGGEPLDRYLPVLLSERVFHVDGQILEEDYEYHSFIQSKMYANNVKCSDCHDVHSTRRYEERNALCGRCHRADTYDVEAHHFHKKVVDGQPSAGALCTSCHMPGQYYMVVHYRHDHSMRVPRPDLSADLGVPNACNVAGCHADKSVGWAVEQYETWYGKTRKPHYGTVLAAGRERRPAAVGDLVELARDQLRPAIVRATALDLLGNYEGNDALGALEAALADPDPLIRRTAASRLHLSDSARLVTRLTPLLNDPVAAVRTEAAARLAEVPVPLLPETAGPTYDRALAEYVEAQRYMSDMPSGPYNLGNLALRRNDPVEAERQYRRALAIDDQNVMAQVNLATLLAGRGRLAEAETLLQTALRAQPEAASIAFNLGLLLAEMGKPAEAEEALRKALSADPEMAPAAYNLAVLIGERTPSEAAALCQRAATTRPDDPRYAWSQAFYQSRAGNIAAAVNTLETLLSRHPAYADTYFLLGELYERQGQRERTAALYRRGSEDTRLPPEARANLARRAQGARPGPGR